MAQEVRGEFTVRFVDSLQEVVEPVLSYLNSAPADRDLFAVDHIIVPNAGVRAWLLQQIAENVGVSDIGNDGIAANVSLSYLGELDALVGRRSFAADPWSVGPLTVTILSVIASSKEPYMQHIARLGEGLRAARLMADRFDRYQARRPSMIIEWENGRACLAPVVGDQMGSDEFALSFPPLDEGDLWQYQLWRDVRDVIGTPPWPVVVRGMVPHDLDITNLPTRLLVVGLQSLSVRHIEMLRLLSHVIDIEVVMVHPSPVLAETWDRASHSIPVSRGIAPEAQRITQIDTETDQLVGMWLRGSHDAQMVLASQGVKPNINVREFLLAEPKNLLQSVQQAVFTGHSHTFPYEKGDPSLQIHRAHNLGRQVEIAHDALLHAFHDIEGLEPHDVVVICADIEAASPLLEATFGRTMRGADGDITIPIVVADRGLRHVDDGAALLVNLLSTVTGRFSVSDVMTIATSELVMRHCGATSDHVSTWLRIVERTNIRWGISGEHRGRVGVEGNVHAHTWMAGIRRALTGAVLPDAEPNIDFGDVVPMADLDVSDLESISMLSSVITAVSVLENMVNQKTERTIVEWADLVERTLMQLAPSERGELDDARASISILRTYVADASGSQVEEATVSFVHFAELLTELISGAPGRQPLRTGAVTATSMVPLRGVPFKVVCLVGFDEGTLSSGESEGDDLLDRQVFVGDSDARIDQRRSILDAICAASERVIVTCNGRSIKNNAEVPLITPLAELVDLCDRCGATYSGSFSPIEIRHPRHFSSPINFLPDAITTGRVWSHDVVALQASQTTGIVDTEASRLAAAIDAQSNASANGSRTGHRIVEPSALESFVRDPLNAFVRSALGISTWRDQADDEPATIPLSLTKPQTTALLQDLASARLAGFSTEQWEQVQSRAGNIPVGQYGTPVATSTTARIDELLAHANNWGINLAQPEQFDIDIPYSGGVVSGSVVALPAQDNRIALVDLNVSAKDKDVRLHLAVQLLLLRAAGHLFVDGVALMYGSKTTAGAKSDAIVSHYVMLDPAIDQSAAQEKIASLALLFERALLQPFPLFGDTAKNVAEGEFDEAKKKFNTKISQDNKDSEGNRFSYISTKECLLFGVTPAFEEVYSIPGEVIDFFSDFFATIPLQNDEALAELDLKPKQIKPPNGGDSRKRYLFS